jgi:hypothetical protein
MSFLIYHLITLQFEVILTSSQFSNRPHLVMIIAIFILISSKLHQYESYLVWFRQMCVLYMRNNIRYFVFAFDHLLTY